MSQSNNIANEIYFTTDPPEVLSITTAFNAAVWTATGAVVGSYLDFPTLQGGEVNLAGIGATAGLGSYLGLVVWNKGIGGFLKSVEDGVVKEVTKDSVKPHDPDKEEAFYKKYGVTWIDAVKRYETEHPEDRAGRFFQEWLDETYLHKLPDRGLTGPQSWDFWKYVLKRSTSPLGKAEYEAWIQGELVDRFRDFKRAGWPGNNFWNWLKVYYHAQ